MKNKMLEKLDRKVELEVLKFAWERYGGIKGWEKRMWHLSPRGICKIYFKEFVNWEDWKEKNKGGVK